MYVTKVTDSDRQTADRPAHEIEITPEMVRAGEERLANLEGSGVASAYLVEEVFAAMVGETGLTCRGAARRRI